MNDTRREVQPGPQAYARNGTLESPRKFYNQDFEALRDIHLVKGVLFTDETFPANMNIIGSKLNVEFNTQNIKWMRPMDLCKNPHFIVDDMNLFDILQSQLGDCWVLSAMGALTLNSTLLKNVVPTNQRFSKNYAGIFHFRLWHLGEWVDIVVDDMLPFLNGQYLSVHPSCANEFWPCLLEKAYAKLLGSYQNLHWGDPAEAFVNFTGGVTVTFKLQSSKVHQDDLWYMISTATRDTLMACINDVQDDTTKKRSSSVPAVKENIDIQKNSLLSNKLPENVYLSSGLVDRHAYCVTDVVQVKSRKGMVKLIRLWNPWGFGEWQGSWNDKSPQWNDLQEEDRKALQRVRNDGEFWMSWDDFLCEFSRLIVCNRMPVFLDWGNQPEKWYKDMYWSKWSREDSSWNIFSKDCFYKNPQYIITVTPSDEVNKGLNAVISLMQSTRNRQKFDGDWLPIGFLLLPVDSKVQESHEKLPSSFFTPEKLSGLLAQRRRDITVSFKLSPGRYVIAPYSTAREQESSFLLQVFLKSKYCTAELGVPQERKTCEVQPYENIFRKFTAKGSKMNAWDLHRSLNDAFIKESPFPNGVKFNIDGSRALLASVDYAGRGILDPQNFGLLWSYLTKFKDVFADIDTSRCGYFSLPDLNKAVSRTGLQVSSDLLRQLIARYGDSEEKLNFVDYLICMVRVKSVSKTFNMLSCDGKGVSINRERWMQLMI
ncbi:calpain-13-like isoform X2 [Pseudophryne corroboree]|uniref:calpain-13-like isoform X2 n=1 Tax=Pseudophryne corroboree TaxID=495146 RepID=UPI0030815767